MGGYHTLRYTNHGRLTPLKDQHGRLTPLKDQHGRLPHPEVYHTGRLPHPEVYHTGRLARLKTLTGEASPLKDTNRGGYTP